MRFKTRYVHKIAPRETDKGPNVDLTESDLASNVHLAAKLRRAKVLDPGARVRSFRKNAQAEIVVFPTMPGLTTYWHSVILTPIV